jgi:hypothetical protein
VFDLRTSPFYLLGISPRDNRAIVAQATETAIAEGTLDEAVATRSQQILMSPRLRLGAEMSWLTGLAPNRVRQLIESVSLDANAVDSLPLLAGANLAAHRCSSQSAPAHWAAEQPPLSIRRKSAHSCSKLSIGGLRNRAIFGYLGRICAIPAETRAAIEPI